MKLRIGLVLPGGSYCLVAITQQVTGCCRNSITSGALQDKFINMPIPFAFIKLTVVLALTSVTWSTISASGQSPVNRPNAVDRGISALQGPRLENPEDKVATSAPKPDGEDNKDAAKKPKSNDLGSEIEAVKAENAAVREQLRRMEETQRILLEQVDRLQRRLDGGAAADLQSNGQPMGIPQRYVAGD